MSDKVKLVLVVACALALVGVEIAVNVSNFTECHSHGFSVLFCLTH